MRRGKEHLRTDGEGGEGAERVSRSERKRRSAALQDLGADLAALPLRELAKLGLAPALLQAFRDLAGITAREARRRQMQYIGRLMREEDDPERLRDAVACFREGRLPSSLSGTQDAGD